MSFVLPPAGCGSERLKQEWRAWASKNHPDRGGSDAEFAAARAKYEPALAAEIAAETLCKTCGGTGHVEKRQGFYALKIRCSACQGRGIVP